MNYSHNMMYLVNRDLIFCFLTRALCPMMQNATKISYTNFRVTVRVDKNVVCLRLQLTNI